MLLKIGLVFPGIVLIFWVSAICGGGASLILIPLLSWFLPASLVPFSLTLGTFASTASRIIVFRKHVNTQILLWFIPFSIPAVVLGAWLIKFMNPLYLQFGVAFFLLLNIPQLFQSEQELQKDEKPYPNYVLALVGFLCGFVSGVIGAVGLLFNRFYLRYGLSKEEIIATRAANEVYLHLIKLIVYASLDLYSETALHLGLLIALAAIVSSFSIKFILPLISNFVFRKVGYGAMVVSGFVMLFSTSSHIIEQDNLSFVLQRNEYESELAVSWRNSHFILEYDIKDGGLAIEWPVGYEDLPQDLQQYFDELKDQYDKILLEKAFKFRGVSSYEFYCYKNGVLTKMDFESILTAK
ncbi:hypothetical protein Nstercoris_00287 [Nitrosomonas stercoris]|uniref:Probable membrane transporter protein n=1 Tax=Nitrosomonas stercoris TaxID=1444684 RepID=A0A4Y1YJQ9_9PROT|nr:hypothetical protein Nstercoris_00287 [Nitrosomonas stercoris]